MDFDSRPHRAGADTETSRFEIDEALASFNRPTDKTAGDRTAAFLNGYVAHWREQPLNFACMHIAYCMLIAATFAAVNLHYERPWF